MAARLMKVAEGNDHLFQCGPGGLVRVDRGLPPDADTPPDWVVYTKVDVTDDEDTTYTYRYDQVERFTEEEPGVMPAAAADLARKLAGE